MRIHCPYKINDRPALRNVKTGLIRFVENGAEVQVVKQGPADTQIMYRGELYFVETSWVTE